MIVEKRVQIHDVAMCVAGKHPVNDFTLERRIDITTAETKFTPTGEEREIVRDSADRGNFPRPAWKKADRGEGHSHIVIEKIRSYRCTRNIYVFLRR